MTLLTARSFGLPALLGLLLLSLPGCQPRAGRAPVREHELLQTSFEGLRGWVADPAAALTLSTEKAHTGRYALRVDPQHPYSVTYKAVLGELVPHHRPRRLTLSAWVWVPGADGDARLVLHINSPRDPGHSVFSQSMFLTDTGLSKRWKLVSRSFDLPENISSDNILVLFMWSGGASAPVYADDVRLTELW